MSESPPELTNLEQLARSAYARRAAFPQTLELKVVLQNHINVNLEHALSLCIILAHETAYPWFYENYVQLYSFRLFRRHTVGFIEVVPEGELRGDEIENIGLQFLAKPGTYWLHECFVRYFFGDDPDDIISFIVRSINLECYLRIEVDEYYLPNKRSYQRREFVHPALVYGYDDESKTLKALGFDAKGYFTRLTISYEDFSRAYASAKQINEQAGMNRWLVTLIQMKQIPHRYPFSIKTFLQELAGYLSSSVDNAKRYELLAMLPPSADPNAVFRFGLGVYEHFELGLKQLARGDNRVMDYNSMHLLFEHKRFLLEAFRFIVAEYNLGARAIELTDSFERVVQEFHSMRWKFIRYNFTKDVRLIGHIIEQFSPAKEQEHELLLRLHEQFQSDCPLPPSASNSI